LLFKREREVLAESQIVSGRYETMRAKTKTIIVTWCFLGLMCGVGEAQDSEPISQGAIESLIESAQRESLIGRWTSQVGRMVLTLTLDQAGQFQITGPNDLQGTYQVAGDSIILRHGDQAIPYQYKVTADALSLSGAGLDPTLEWHRSLHLDKRSLWKDSFSWQSFKTRAYRFLFIVIVIVACRLFLWVLRGLFHVLIYSRRGPLKYIYRHHKSRTMTIYSILLNASKYVVYVLAIGFVLNELGINYTTYLASLSVVGLAIGFGSQGLVQDMVTGFFIIFEDQFNVGDMVEVNKHVGVVEELGLRMTRIKNYEDQRVVIPNRNISIVGNFSGGALTTHVDMAVADKQAFEILSKAMVHVAGQVKQQFDRLIMDVPKSATQVKLDTGESFARLELRLWPGQKWVIDQQLVPRLREYCASHAIKIPQDRVIVFYGSGRVRSVRANQQPTTNKL